MQDRNRDADVENGLVDAGQTKARGEGLQAGALFLARILAGAGALSLQGHTKSFT